MDAPELLPCPFCAKPPEGPFDATTILGVWRIIHRCKIIGPFSIECSNRDEAIAAWNTRAPLSPAVLAAMRGGSHE